MKKGRENFRSPFFDGTIQFNSRGDSLCGTAHFCAAEPDYFFAGIAVVFFSSEAFFKASFEATAAGIAVGAFAEGEAAGDAATGAAIGAVFKAGAGFPATVALPAAVAPTGISSSSPSSAFNVESTSGAIAPIL